MATYTVDQLINRALRLLGVLAEGESPSAETSADAFMAFVQMIDSWNTERLSVFSTMDQIFTWPAGEKTRTLGPTGDFVGQRPITVDDSTYYKYNNISYNIQIINQDQYNSIALKSTTTTLPSVMWINESFPDVEITIYPVPTGDLEFHFVSVEPLTEPADINQDLLMPPGYLRAFVYNLALELAPEFGVSPSADVRRVAMVSKRNIKRINNPEDVMSFSAAILGRPGWFNVYSGESY